MYKRICKTLNDIGTLVPLDKKVETNNKDDYYESIFYYTDEQKKLAEEKVEKNGRFRPKGVSGITDVVTNKLVWDLDNEMNLDFAKKDTIELVQRLYKKGFKQSEVRICFSGKKGFAVEVRLNEMITPLQFHAITSTLAEGLSSYDSVVKNPSRILRLPHTRHQDTGLFKTPYKLEDLRELSVDEIKQYSDGSYEDEISKTWTVAELGTELKEMKVKEASQKPEKGLNSGPVSKLKIDYSRNPLGLTPWKLAISQGLFPPGTRSNSLMILAATLKAKRFDETDCYYALKSAADKQSEIFGVDKFSKDEIWENIISQIYGDNWTGATYSTENFPQKLREFLLEQNIPENSKLTDADALISITDVFDVFDDYATNIEANTIRTGIQPLDDIVRMTTSMLVGVLGAPGAGKTSLLLNILNYMSLSEEESVFFSLDMGRPLVYQKLATRCTKYSSDDIFHFFKNGNEEKKQEIKEKIDKNYKNVQFCFKTGSTVDDLREYILNYEQTTGKKVRLVAVDYLEKVSGPYSDPTANSGHVAKKLQELANDLQVCVLMLLQPQKSAGEPSSPLLSYRNVKGASLIEQDCRVIISLWREGFNPQHFEDDKFITFAVLKNTMGETGMVEMGWDGKQGRIYELTAEEKTDLVNFKKAKTLAKELDKKDRW